MSEANLAEGGGGEVAQASLGGKTPVTQKLAAYAVDPCVQPGSWPSSGYGRRQGAPFVTNDAAVPTTGVEPARPFGHQHLKLACLPKSTTWA